MKSRQVNYLDKKDILKIKLCCVLPYLARTAFFCSVLLIVEWLLLVMIDEIGFDGKTAGIETILLLIITVSCVISFFVVARLYPLFTIRGKKWKELCEKIEMHEQGLNGTESTDAVLDQENKSSTFGRYPYELAQACNITIPNIKMLRIAIFLVPIVFMLAVFVPKIAESSEAKQQKNELAAYTMQQLESAFTQDGVMCTGKGVGEDMRDEYDFTVRRTEDLQKCYFNVVFNEEAEIFELMVSMNTDETKTAQENMDEFFKYIQENVQLLKKSGVKVNIPDLERHTQPSQQLTGKYLESEGKMDYIESVKEGDVKVWFSNNCNDVTPQNPAYLYFSVESYVAK